MRANALSAPRRIWFVSILVAIGVVVALLPLVPGLSSARNVSLLTTIVIAAALATAWNVVGGLAGQLSFAHSIFLACGAYGSGVLSVRLGWHPLVGGVVGVAIAVALGAIIAYLCARYDLSHLLFALATAAFSMIALYFVKGNDWLGGSFGLSIPNSATPGELYFADDRLYYWIFLCLLAITLTFTFLIRRRRLGTYFLAVREDEVSARAIGIDVVRVKVRAMAISAGLTAIVGVFYGNYLRFLAPESLIGFHRSLLIVIPAILGGTSLILGPVVGAMIYGFIVERGHALLDMPGGPQILLGALLAAIILFLPRGILPGILKLVSVARHRRRRRGREARA